MQQKTKRIIGVCAVALAILIALAALTTVLLRRHMESQRQLRHDATGYVMNTMVDQTIYGPHGEAASADVLRELAAFEQYLSLFDEGSDIAAINAMAGLGPVETSAATVDLLRRSVELSAVSEGTFAVTIAPLTLAWGVTGDSPRVVPQAEVELLLPLVDDSAIRFIDEYTVELPVAGMAIDLGGIAKGEACSYVQRIYNGYGIESALLSIGGNILAHGVKPDGSPFTIGFRSPEYGATGYIASFEMTDQIIAVSGGYERFFEQDGETYIHIIDPRTGRPAQSDIASVGVICDDGAEADFWSTTLFVLGRDRALEYMRAGELTCILLDEDNNLYVSERLLYENQFQLNAATAADYTLIAV